MKKTLAVVVSITFFGSLLSIPAFAAIKAGATCSKAGSTAIVSGKKFTCIKNSHKLVWDKGTPVSALSPTPSTSAEAKVANAFLPWSSKFEAQKMVDAALAATDNYFGKVTPSTNYEITIDLKILDSDRKWVTSMLDYTNGAYSKIERDKVRVFLGTTHTWSKATLQSANLWIGDPQGPYPCSQGINDAYCADRNVILLIYSDIYGPESKYYHWDVGRLSTPAHEMFHTIQFSLAGPNMGPDSNLHIPRWLMEGSANFVGFYFVGKLGFDKYQNGRNSQVTQNQAYKDFVPLKDYDNFTSDPYGIGQAATEYLIASIGFENFLNIWRFTKSESDFKEGFKKATGLEINDFYSKFESARTSMKIGPLS